MTVRAALFALALVVLLGGVAVVAVDIRPSCPEGFYRDSGGLAIAYGPGSITSPTPCTSYATHRAPSSGVTIPRYATGLDPRVGQKLAMGGAALVLSAGLAGLAWRRPSGKLDESEVLT